MTMERWTEDARKVAEMALREALALGHNYVAPEHILLAMLRYEDTIPTQVLSSFHYLDAYRQQVLRLVTEQQEAKRQAVPASRLDAIETRLDILEAQRRTDAA